MFQLQRAGDYWAPRALWDDLFDNFIDEVDLILEPFAGAGTTFVAEQQLDRVVFGCEIGKHCVQHAPYNFARMLPLPITYSLKRH